MKRATREWADKAEGDWQVARRESESPSPVWDAVCFHAQQCAEKYLKASLEEHGIAFPKTHDLVVLLTIHEKRVPELEALRSELAYLSPLAIVTRYPGSPADAELAGSAIQIAGKARAIIRIALRLNE
jgi:HEPN domain-containing protein